MIELGSCEAVIYKLATTADGGVRLTLDIDASNQDIIKDLMGRKLSNKPLITIGIIGHEAE